MKIAFAAGESIQLPKGVLGFSLVITAGNVTINPPFRNFGGLNVTSETLASDFESGDGEWGGYQLTSDGSFSGTLRLRVGGKPSGSNEGRKK